MRANLSPAQEALAVSRRKEIYELLHPETCAGAAGANARWNASDNLSFASATAEATGKDKRTVERAAARGEALGDDLKAVEGTSLDKGVELDALAKKPAPSLDDDGAGQRMRPNIRNYNFTMRAFPELSAAPQGSHCT